jgi:hypothetical protein
MSEESNKSSKPVVRVAVVRQVDGLIRQALDELEALVKLREQLTGEDLLGDQCRGREHTERMRAQMRARDPEGWARAHAWALGVMERFRQRQPEPTIDPGADVDLAVEVIHRWRQVRRDESRRGSERIRQLIADRNGPDDGGATATSA